MVNCFFETENNRGCFLALNLSSLNVNMSLSIEIYPSATLPFHVFAALKLISIFIFSFNNESPMLHTNFHGNRPTSYRNEDS